MVPSEVSVHIFISEEVCTHIKQARCDKAPEGVLLYICRALGYSSSRWYLSSSGLSGIVIHSDLWFWASQAGIAVWNTLRIHFQADFVFELFCAFFLLWIMCSDAVMKLWSKNMLAYLHLWTWNVCRYSGANEVLLHILHINIYVFPSLSVALNVKSLFSVHILTSA